MNRYKINAILIFTVVSLAAGAAGGHPHSDDMEVIQSMSQGYYVSVEGVDGVNIGKVYEDLNGDGYQADATAENIVIRGGVDSGSYIPNTTVIQLGSEEDEVDGIPLMEEGVEIDELQGVVRGGSGGSNRAVIRFETTEVNWKPLEVTTKGGSKIVMDPGNDERISQSGQTDRGLAGENLKITRNVYRQKGGRGYLQEIIVENLGIYEEGIPGVRLITLDGTVVETDIYGRYHIPDEWIVKRGGENYLIKVDKTTLPEGMRVISENPRVRRITPHGLNRIDFSIQNESGEGDGND